MICIIDGQWGKADLPTMWFYHNSLEQVPKSQMLVPKELKWRISGRWNSIHCGSQAIKTLRYKHSEVTWTYSHCAVLCLQSTAQHSTGCWYTYTAKQLILIVHIHLGVLNVGQVFSRHWNSDPTSRNPFRNFNLKWKKERKKKGWLNRGKAKFRTITRFSIKLLDKATTLTYWRWQLCYITVSRNVVSVINKVLCFRWKWTFVNNTSYSKRLLCLTGQN